MCPDKITDFKPLTKQTWPELLHLFGDRGACGGCWCMYWRKIHREYEEDKGLENKKALLDLVNGNSPLGILGFVHELPVSWCSVSPKKQLVRLETSRILQTPQQEGIWSITCLFVKKTHRNLGFTSRLIHAAAQYGFANGALAIEAYPIVPKKDKMPDAFAWVGFVGAFQKAGFYEISRPTVGRVIMRLDRS